MRQDGTRRYREALLFVRAAATASPSWRRPSSAPSSISTTSRRPALRRGGQARPDPLHLRPGEGHDPGLPRNPGPWRKSSRNTIQAKGCTYKCVSRDATTEHGGSTHFAVMDRAARPARSRPGRRAADLDDQDHPGPVIVRDDFRLRPPQVDLQREARLHLQGPGPRDRGPSCPPSSRPVGTTIGRTLPSGGRPTRISASACRRFRISASSAAQRAWLPEHVLGCTSTSARRRFPLALCWTVFRDAAAAIFPIFCWMGRMLSDLGLSSTTASPAFVCIARGRRAL